MDRRTFSKGAAAAAFLLSHRHLFADAKELTYDIAVIGGGVGGFAATISALRLGQKVVLTEETDWVGGQLTAQAVPPDEHMWIEECGATGSYHRYRQAVRQYYRDYYPLTVSARNRPNLNPGDGAVSRLTHEFRVSVEIMQSMLMPYISNGQLTLLLQHVPVSATTSSDRVTSITVRDLSTGQDRTLTAKYFLDATELGDCLPLTGTEFVTGAEAKSETGEMHASEVADPKNSQSFTYCFAMDYMPGEDHTIEKPKEYDFWSKYVPDLKPAWTGRLFDWTSPVPRTLKPGIRYLGIDKPPNGDNAYWTYRRIANRENFVPGHLKSDITLVNWPQNDFWLTDLVTADISKRTEIQNRAKQQSLSFLYWMQTEAPNQSGGTGFPGLRLRKDIVGTEDGLAKAAYIRESRRIKAEFTIKEMHVGTQMRQQITGKSGSELLAEAFPDTVGVGAYRIDLHPSASGTNYIDVSSLRFQIPLGALLPVRMENLLPACKNIGTTHISNGCYRLHPVEWNIGEASGALASFALTKGCTPRTVRSNAALLSEFQTLLRAQGFELQWPESTPL